MKKLILFLFVFISLSAFAQDDKIVTLVVIGHGNTKDEAKQKALRSAIEQAFGTFISSQVGILNDNLVKDEIVSVSNGNIQKFEVISDVQTPNGDYVISLKATVSVTKLTSFVESKGIAVEFKGNLFAFNVNQQILNEKNEIKAINDMCDVITKLSDASFDYTISISDPIAVNGSNEQWNIPVKIGVSVNKNFSNIANYMYNTLKGLSLSIDDAKNYRQLAKSVYPISLAANYNQNDYFILRSRNSIAKLISQLYYFNHSIQNFTIINGIASFRISEKKMNNLTINDINFRPFILKVGKCMQHEMYSKGSVFFDATGSNGYQKVTMIKEPILEWSSWKNIQRQWHGCGFGWAENYIGYDFRAYSTIYPYGDYFDQNFSFVGKLSEKFIDGDQSGLVIDFSTINLNEEVITISFTDVRSLSEINKITGYKVSPINN